MTSIKSPWGTTFDQFAASIRESAIIAAPCITRQPVERLMRAFGRRRKTIKLSVLTSLHPDHLIDGSLDVDALSLLCNAVPGTSVRHLLHLHAKAYVADRHTAIVTSANLTNGGIWRNHELGIAITDPTSVKDIAEDLKEYGNLGIPVSGSQLTELHHLSLQAQSGIPSDPGTHPRDPNPGRTRAHNAINEKLIALRTGGEEFVSNPDGSLTANLPRQSCTFCGVMAPCLPAN